MTISDIKALADEQGYSVSGNVKSLIIESFLEAQEKAVKGGEYLTDFGEKIKKSLRIKHSSLDDEIESNIEICLLLLRGVGISEEKACADTQDMLIFKACELYCKWQFNFDNQAERFEKAFEGLRDFLSLGGEYTNGSTE